MKCKFCTINKPDKTNTHYLTDSIIRRCLNENGSNEKEKGLMFNMSSDSGPIDFRFQRNTSQTAIVEVFGRETTDEENEEAKNLIYSVDYIFCTSCEKKFGEIENPFINKILPKLRDNDLTTISEKSFSDSILIRKFFLLQVWRTSICDSDFEIIQSFQESLRTLLFNNGSPIEEELLSFPLSITFLNTLGGDYEYTKNYVGTGVWKDNRVIFLCDFIIQIACDGKMLSYNEWFGINDKNTFQHFINVNEKSFLVKILSNEHRLAFCATYSKYRAEIFLTDFRKFFIEQYYLLFKRKPTFQLVNSFFEIVKNGNDCTDSTRYTLKRVIRCMTIFFRQLPFNPYHKY